MENEAGAFIYAGSKHSTFLTEDDGVMYVNILVPPDSRSKETKVLFFFQKHSVNPRETLGNLSDFFQ
jgi:hypothetical protein